MLIAALASCRAAPAARSGSAVGAARFPGADGILSGIDPAEAGADWRAGDRVLFALSTESGTRTRAKLVEIELLGPSTLAGKSDASSMELVESLGMTATVGSRNVRWSSPLLRVAVRVHEVDGELVQETEAKVPETVLRSGLHQALELSDELKARAALAGGAPPGEPSDQDVRVFGEAIAMVPTLLRILQGDGVLESLLMQVVGPPPFLSLFRGIHVHVSFDTGQASLVEHPPALSCVSGSVYRVPLHLAVNDDPTLEMQLHVASADPPLRLSGGILALTGVSCRNAKRTVTLELLAARRGPPGAEFRP